MTAELGIALVTYNSADWIERCLDSVPAAAANTSYEVVVVDNASGDDSAEVVSGAHPEIDLIRNTTNVGFAAAVNQAVARSSAPWVLLLNPDVELHPGSLDALLTFARQHPANGIYGGRALRADGSVEPSSCWALPTLWSTFCFALGITGPLRGSPVFDPESMGRWARDSVREVGMVTGCVLLAPRTVWDELDGLDERFFVYGEDADLAARARAKGYRPILTPEARYLHEIGASSDSSGKIVLLMAGKITYLQRNWTGRRRALGIALLRRGTAFRALLARLTGRGARWRTAWQQRDQWWDGFPPRPDPG